MKNRTKEKSKRKYKMNLKIKKQIGYRRRTTGYLFEINEQLI